MAVERVDAIDSGTLERNKVVTLIGHYEDGREWRFEVDVFRTLGGFAYGGVLAVMEEQPGSGTFVHDGKTGRIARIPLEGIIEPGEVEIEVTSQPIWGDYVGNAIESSKWEQVKRVPEALELVDRT